MNFSLVELAQVILADIFLSGDNAIIIGMAAAGLSEKFRKRVIFWGLALAAGFRIIFAAIASFLIQCLTNYSLPPYFTYILRIQKLGSVQCDYYFYFLL